MNNSQLSKFLEMISIPQNYFIESFIFFYDLSIITILFYLLMTYPIVVNIRVQNKDTFKRIGASYYTQLNSIIIFIQILIFPTILFLSMITTFGSYVLLYSFMIPNFIFIILILINTYNNAIVIPTFILTCILTCILTFSITYSLSNKEFYFPISFDNKRYDVKFECDYEDNKSIYNKLQLKVNQRYFDNFFMFKKKSIPAGTYLIKVENTNIIKYQLFKIDSNKTYCYNKNTISFKELK